MTNARPRKAEYQEHVAIDPVMEAVIERCGNKGARQLGNCLNYQGSGVLPAKVSELGEAHSFTVVFPIES
ncbi:hypothetical protein Syun_000505 [Stephania yunnanensis]|uniref:Uncharacterized protein n=1 Tax=Stephania yunnanensis TaxID=152371 RepID=A0AAP0LD60_9MAGN